MPAAILNNPIIIVTMSCGILMAVVYDVLALALIVRIMLNSYINQRVKAYIQEKGFFAVSLYLSWRSITFQYFENLSRKSWMSSNLRWHIRIYRVLLLVVLLLLLLMAIVVSWYINSYINSDTYQLLYG